MWKIVKVVIGACIATTVSCMLAACGGGGSATGNDFVTSSSQIQQVQYTLSAKTVSKPGDAIPISFLISNIGNSDVPLTGIRPSIAVYKDNIKVWGLPTVTETTAFRNSSGLLPGGAYSFEFSWDQKDAAGNLVTPGNYVIKSVYLNDNEQVTITIQ